MEIHMPNKTPTITPVFKPSLHETRGYMRYDDNRVRGEVEITANNDLIIWDWFSGEERKGYTTDALKWLQSEGFARIIIRDATLQAMSYWLHMQGKGLVHVIEPEKIIKT